MTTCREPQLNKVWITHHPKSMQKFPFHLCNGNVYGVFNAFVHLMLRWKSRLQTRLIVSIDIAARRM
jgi:hypothetical protein